MLMNTQTLVTDGMYSNNNVSVCEDLVWTNYTILLSLVLIQEKKHNNMKKVCWVSQRYTPLPLCVAVHIHKRTCLLN
jgi:hypothetical protein